MNMKEWRTKRGISQADAGELIGVTPWEWCRWEQGRVAPTIHRAVEIINASGGEITLEALAAQSAKPSEKKSTVA